MAGGAIASLRDADPDRFLSVLYAPEAHRAALSTLYLFNAEVASIRDRVSQPLPGEIRLQWWRDALAGGGEAAGGHPLATQLVDVIARYDLPLAAFDRTLEARIFDLYDDPMPSRTDLEGYCGETASTLIQLAALVLDAKTAPAFAPAAGHAGCAQAIAGLLRLLPIHTARGQCYVPADILAASGTNRDEFVAGRNPAAARRAVVAMVALGREHDRKFRQEARGMPAALRPAFLPAGLARSYLDRISGKGFDPFQESADISALKKHWIMLKHAMRGW